MFLSPGSRARPRIRRPVASLQTASLSPTGTTSAAGVMMGLGSTSKMTPVLSGRLQIAFSGYASTSAVASYTLTLRFGTGTAPSNGAAATGTVVGAVQVGTVSAIGFDLPLSVLGIVTGLSLRTPYWFDLQGGTSAGTLTLPAVSACGFEF